MDIIAKIKILYAVSYCTLADIHETFREHTLIYDNTYFDCDLLKIAIRRCDPEIVDFLLFCGCRVQNPNKFYEEDQTPLHIAAKLGNTMIIKRILERGASIYSKNASRLMPIYLSFKQSYMDACKEILKYCCQLQFLNPVNQDDIVHFHIACVINDVSAAKVYMQCGFNLNMPLTVSLNVGEHQQFKQSALLKSAWINSGQTPLQFAAAYRYEELVTLLLEFGAGINVVDHQGRTPLHYSISSYLTTYNAEEPTRNISITLLECNARVDIADSSGRTALHEAFILRQNEKVEKNKQSVFEIVLSKLQLGTTNVTDFQGLSYLHIMCTTNDVKRVEALIKTGVDVNLRVRSGRHSGYTPLHFAVLYNQKKVVELLLKLNANVNLQSGDQKTPLHLACDYSYMKFYDLVSKFDWQNKIDETTSVDWKLNCRNQMGIIRLLLSRGANTELRGSWGVTVLLHVGSIDYSTKLFLLDWLKYCTISYNNLSVRLRKIVAILVRHEAYVGQLDKSYRSILHILSKYTFLRNSERLIKFLVMKGADIDAADNSGQTPLHSALMADNKEMVKALLMNKANPNKPFVLRTPLELSFERIRDSVENTHIKNDILCLLLEYGSDVNELTAGERTPLNYAISEMMIFVTDKLLQYGADINLLNPSMATTVNRLIIEKYSYEVQLFMNVQYFHMFKIIYVHVQKLLALELQVVSPVQNLCTDFYPKYKEGLVMIDNLTDVDSTYDDCKCEVNKMRLIKFDDDISLYDILVQDDITVTKYVKNEHFMRIMNDILAEHFPLYGHLILLRFKRGLANS